MKNVFACLVHENPECIRDLVHNLRHLDPASTVLLYDGGRDPGLLARSLEDLQDGHVLVHPSPRPMKWGTLHEFALDSMRYALEHPGFDALTIVDSDQLSLRPGYSEFIGRFLSAHPDVGMLGKCVSPLGANSAEGPVRAAFAEIELWRPWLRRFPEGEQKFGCWTFWPSTVFTAAAARALTDLFDRDTELREIVSRSRIWATEEVFLPLWTSLLGFRIAVNPCGYEYVEYRVPYSLAQLERALSQPDVFWMHPVPRQYGDPLRARIREWHGDYRREPVLQRLQRIQGWLSVDEARVLMETAGRAIGLGSEPAAIVEVGSYQGRATVVLGGVAQAAGARTRVFAIDPHDGVVAPAGEGLLEAGRTLEAFQGNIAAAGLWDVVTGLCGRAVDVAWNQPIAYLLIDGLHDYANVSRDFRRFEEYLTRGAYIAFHAYAPYFPGVVRFVDELLAAGDYEIAARVESMIVLRRRQRAKGSPRVSCLMPTANRPAMAARAIRHYLRQDYADRELIVIDDGASPIRDLIPAGSSIQYIRRAGPMTIGAKHNLACEQASGDVMIHWDDDDWMANWRVGYQVRELLASSAPLCGLSRLHFYEPASRRAWQYIYSMTGKPWVAGGTFCYAKDFWRDRRFPDMNEGGDTVYVWGLEPNEVAALADNRFYVATVHPGNTSPKRTAGRSWHPVRTEDIRALVDEEDWKFYESLAGGPTPDPSL